MGMQLGAAVRKARREKKLSQSGLARLARCQQGTISRIEDGGRGGTDPTLRRLAQALGVSFEELRRLRDLDDGEADIARAVQGAGHGPDLVERILRVIREHTPDRPYYRAYPKAA